MVRFEGNYLYVFKHDLILWLWGVTVKILHVYRVIFISSTQQALPNGEDSSHFTEGETKARSSYLTQRPSSCCWFQHAGLWAPAASEVTMRQWWSCSYLHHYRNTAPVAVHVPFALCFCKSNCVSVRQLSVFLICDSNDALTKILSRNVCEQSYILHWLAPCASFCSLCEARVKYSCSRMGRENSHPVEVQAPFVVGMSSRGFWQATGNQVCAGHLV